MEQNNIPEFMKDYYQGSDEEGQILLQRIADRYEKERQNYMQNIHAPQQTNLDAWNQKYGTNKKVDPEVGLHPIREKHRLEAEKLALQHGYIPKDQQTKQKVTSQQEQEDEKLTTKQAFTKNLESIRERQTQHKPRLG